MKSHSDAEDMGRMSNEHDHQTMKRVCIGKRFFKTVNYVTITPHFMLRYAPGHKSVYENHWSLKTLEENHW